jgi:hypothetical protein
MVVRFARENRSWATTGSSERWRICVIRSRIDGREHPAPTQHRASTRAKSSTTWKEFIQSHMDVLAGTDFFHRGGPVWRGLMTYYVQFFVEAGSTRVSLSGITRHPDSCWMEQVAPLPAA